MEKFPLRIGVIDYLNALPFFAAFYKGEIPHELHFVAGVPSALNCAMRMGKLDISLISSVEYLQQREKYVISPKLCLGAKECVKSVCLYTRVPLADLHGKSIGVTSQSATSVQLLKVLCQHYWKISPTFTTIQEPLKNLNTNSHQAILLIGNDCLYHPVVQDHISVDLAQAWFEYTGLPFVFALFASRKEVVNSRGREVDEFYGKVQQALQWSRQNPDVLIKIASEKYAIPPHVVQAYYPLLQYEMTLQHRKGFAKFAKLLENL